MLKPPRPGSTGAIAPPAPPPPSCSPLSGKSSSNTSTESLPVGSGVGSTSTFTGLNAEVVVQAFGPPRALQAAGIGAPLIEWPHVPVLPAVASRPLHDDGPV